MSKAPVRPAYHVAALSVSFELAVDTPEHSPHFHECHRNGERKRVYDSPAPEHYFHLQYQLLPPSGCGGVEDGAECGKEGGMTAGVSKSDVVTFGVVSKVYTEQDVRVVRCWNEEEEQEEEEGEQREKEEFEGEEKKPPKSRTHFGWRHKHSFPVSEELLLQLYDHTMEVRLWNTRDKLAPRARFDRPRAFRLPVPPPSEEGKKKEERRLTEKFSLVRQEAEQTGSTRGRRRGRMRKKANYSSLSEEDTDPDLSRSITEVPHSPTKEVTSLDEIATGGNQMPTTDQIEPEKTTEDDKIVPTTDESGANVSLAKGQSEQTKTTADESGPVADQIEPQMIKHAADTVPLQDHEMLNSVVLHHSSIFALHDSHVPKSKSSRVTAEAAEKARVEREGIVLLKLKMADLFAKRDSISANMEASTDNIRVFAVSVALESPLMSDAHRKSLNPTVVTVHRANNLPTQHLIEQQERCDPVHVSYQFHNLPLHHTPGHPHSRDITWDDSHVILLGTIDQDLLVEYLRGPPLVMEVHDRDRCLDNVQHESLFGAEQRDELLGTHAFGAGGGVSEVVCERRRPWDPFGVAHFNLTGLLSGERMVKLTAPLISGAQSPPSREDTRVGPHGRELPPPLPVGDYLDSHSHLTVTVELSHPLPPPSLPPLPSLTPPCPFTRLVYLTSVDDPGLNLVHRILESVNESNTAALGLGHLPADILPTALSTYKLTKGESEGGECDVVTGVQVRDCDVSLLVLEGLSHGAVSRLWSLLPRHSSQDAGLVKTFYNSGYRFSRRLYGQLDVDLPLIFLPIPLSSLTQLPPLFIRGTVSEGALRALLCLYQMTVCSTGGMAHLVRNSLFPSCEEIAALAAQFGTLPPGSGGGGVMELPEPGTGMGIRPEGGEVSHSHTPVPHGSPMDKVVRRRRVMKELLDMENREYEKLLSERKAQETVDHIDRNIAQAHSLSEKAGRLPVNVRRRKTRMRALTDSHVHLYSSQRFNSGVLARARMRAELYPPDHTHQLYTYCQDYHSMTFEPVDPPTNTEPTQRVAERGKWRTREGLIYPGVPTTRRSNTHPKTPHSSRAQELSQPFRDGLLHANTMKPTVDRLHFPWGQRGDDFTLHYRLPPEFGPRPPVSIHLAGGSRASELRHFQELASQDWRSKIIVKDTRFHTHRRGIRTELREKTGPQTRKFENILKDSPNKLSLGGEGFCLEPIPPLDVVVRNVDGGEGVRSEEGGGEGGVFQPGSGGRRQSLKVDGNVVPVRYQRTPTTTAGQRAEWRETHDKYFRLFYHTHSPVSKRVILPLSPSEMCPPLFPSSSSSPHHPQDTPTTS